MPTRRDLIKGLGAIAIAGSTPTLALARTASKSKMVLVVLRGAVDGLALAAPYGDGNYKKQRGELALSAPGDSSGLLKLDGLFGLNPGLASVHQSFQDGEAAIVHAISSPYRSRSHFDGQDMLENGGASVGALRDGWLNRALSESPRDLGNELAIALAPNTPLVLRGDNSVTSWAPSKLPDAESSTIVRLQSLYADDEFFATRLQQALRSQDIAGEQVAENGGGRNNDARQFAELMSSAANFLTANNGPNIAVLEYGGWDTHANQGSDSGALRNRFEALDNGIAELKNGLGEDWSDTAVVVVTEFGRTVRVNGTRGTDHGTGTAAIVIGGAVSGGRVIADWPGLADKNLYSGRDLQPTADVRSLFKSVLGDHMGVSESLLEEHVFPQSKAASRMSNLIRT